ncbi:DUF922 domain-containing protein [Dokdonia sinensis]|uniref:DUF922 domain-containing protein n=1 Tax=Dokdonia sinensis TaxID=2479847 RepID=A0A3M0GRQ6_9FLAO|nr:DUF922 domain-containing protein [Dokdonia sinensis]RMB63879.1 DUF922 domain-containing protein [Dokdonia sinensis]
MIRSFSYILGILCSFLCVSAGAPPERLAWDEDRILTWNDFKGAPQTVDGFAASSSTGISQAYEIDSEGYLNKPGTKVTAHFYPEFSWYQTKDTSDHLLNHERAHFDITEIYARKLRERILEFKFTSNSKAEIQALYNQVEKERQAMQQQFDLETNHSRNHSQELAWHKEIYKMLEEYWVYTE